MKILIKNKIKLIYYIIVYSIPQTFDKIEVLII